MATTSSDTSYMNIGIVETSSHSEIEPEIEVVEAIEDSDEVCGLERKQCDKIMEHLKNNPGLVVKSLSSEGQIVLHVAVMIREATEKPKLPTFECNDKGFSKAKKDSPWDDALQSNDYNILMSLLQENPCFVAQTDFEGKTVVHAALESGCLKLFDQVLDLFKDHDGNYFKFVDKKLKMEVKLYDLLTAKWGQCEVQFQNIAWYILPRNSYVFHHPKYIYNYPNKHDDPKKDHAILSLNHTLFEIIQRETSKKAFEGLEYEYQIYIRDSYIGLRSIEEMQFHCACEFLLAIAAQNYLKTIIDGFLELGTSECAKALMEVFQLHNGRGETPFHATYELTKLLEIVPKGNAYKACVNVKDVRGWTTLHYNAATKGHKNLEALLKDERTDVNARTSITERDLIDEWAEEDANSDSPSSQYPQHYREEEASMTALHLAILHKDAMSVELLLKHSQTDVNALLYRWIVCGYETTLIHDDLEKLQERAYWTPVQLAAIMGQSNIVRALLTSPKVCDIYNDKKLQDNNNEERTFRNVSPLLLACAFGDPDTLRLFIDNPNFDVLVKSKEEATALYYATNAMIPIAKGQDEFRYYKVDPILYFSDFGRLHDTTCCIYKEETEDEKLISTSYLGRKACITMLLQSGVDIWEKDNQNRLANPGSQAPKETLLWWQEQMARETLEAKKSLNDVANAISVVAALVATASFVGPLQPPLGYGGDSIESGVQDTHLSIRVFMVSNILSFYFAVASIMFAVVPSLPMPQEGIYAEWKRTRRSVGVAIFFLLMSVLNVLISFGTASNLVVSEDYSWQHVGLSFYPTLLGGFICILGINLFFIRLLRLVFHRNEKIRHLYKTFVRI